MLIAMSLIPVQQTVAQSPIDTSFTYQGRLLQSGQYIANATCDFQFALYDDSSNGTQIGTYQSASSTTVRDGYFTVNLDFGNVFNGNERYLEVWVKCPPDATFTVMGGRVPMTSAPYSQYAQSVPWSGISSMPTGFADGIDDGQAYSAGEGIIISSNVISTSFGGNGSTSTAARSDHNHDADYIYSAGTGLNLTSNTFSVDFGTTSTEVAQGNHNHFGQTWTDTKNGYGLLIRNSNTTGGAGAIRGESTGGGSSATYGVYGTINSTNGAAVNGWASAGTGSTTGVLGQSDSTSGKGVVGQAGSTTGVTFGVTGSSASDQGRGVLGNATAATGTTYGVYGSSASVTGRGVYGKAPNGGYGVYGESTAVAGYNYGVYGKTDNPGGGGRGVYGETNSFGGAGGYFVNTNDVPVGPNVIVGANATEVVFKVTTAGNVYADGPYSGSGADMAEMVLPGQPDLEAGDVLVIGPDGTMIRSSEAYQGAVAGVYSTEPGFVAGQTMDEQESERIPLAVVGIVPVKVSAENGSIHPGDLLTSSDTSGHAMRCEGAELCFGRTIGKALEPLDGELGVIKMLAILQ